VRLGWGQGALAPRVSTDPFDDASPTHGSYAKVRRRPEPPPTAESAALRRLACTPHGSPVPLAAPLPAPPGARQTVSTGWGDTMEIVRDAAAPEPPPSPGSLPVPPPPPVPPGAAPAPTAAAPASTSTPAAGASARPRKPPRPSPAVLRTHTLLVRQPFAPFAPVRRLNATDGSFNPHRRALVVPLLTPAGGVDLLVGGDQSELLVTGDKITSMPLFDTRRYYYGESAGFSGLSLPGGRALIFGESRRRLALEDHGPGVPPPPLYVGLERDHSHRRPMAIARRDDGTAGVLILDGNAPETVGVAPIDRLAGVVRPTVRLAPWSAALGGDDPRCRKGADPSAWEALLLIDPAAWLRIDPATLPGVTLAHAGLLHVRWGAFHVCVLGLDAAAFDAHRPGGAGHPWSLVARWGADKDHGAALRGADLRQDLTCRIEPDREEDGGGRRPGPP
jgi:hypothetical protein